MARFITSCTLLTRATTSSTDSSWRRARDSVGMTAMSSLMDRVLLFRDKDAAGTPVLTALIEVPVARLVVATAAGHRIVAEQIGHDLTCGRSKSLTTRL